jgi:hypothetical protein
MAAPYILLPQSQTEVIRAVPDVRSLAYGGYFGNAIPDQDRNHNDLYEFDATVTSAANIVARGATNVDATRQTNQIAANRAVQIVRSEKIDQDEMEFMATVGRESTSPAVVSRLTSMAERIQRRNLEGAEITRGYLASCMAVGEIDWSYLGFVADSIDFRMPATLRLTPPNYDRTGVASTTFNAAGTPVSNMFALDYQAEVLGMPAFDMAGMSYQEYLAMLQTTEYQTLAKSTNSVYLNTSLPSAQSPRAKDLAEAVIGKQIVWLDQTFQRELIGGGRETVRYVKDYYTVLWHKADEGSAVNWEMSNVPLTKSMVANLGENSPFGGVVRGPKAWAAWDRDEYNWARLLLAWEGFPMRRALGVTAVIYNRAPINGQ